MEGFLEKKSPVLIKGWQKRFFLISQEHLLYFKDLQVGLPPFKPKGVIPIADIKKVDYLDPKKNEFVILIGKRSFLLKAESQEIKEKWLDALRLPLNQEGKAKYIKMKWIQVPLELKASIYLEREANLKQNIEAISGPVDKEALIAKRLDKMHEKFGDKANDYIFRAFIQKPSVKTLGMKKTRWLVIINTLSMFNQDPITTEQQNNIPQMFDLDTIYLFKYENKDDRTLYTKFQVKIQEILAPLLVIETDFSVKFTYQEKTLQYFFTTITEAKRFCDLIHTVIQNDRKLTQSKERQKATPQYYVSDTRRIQGTYAKGRIIMEGQLEQKINQQQWKNAVVTLKEECLYWIQIDQEILEHLELFKIQSIEKSYRVFTITTKKGEQLSFKASTNQEKEDWCYKLSAQTQIEVIQQQQQTKQSYMRGSLSIKQQQQQQQSQQQQQQQIQTQIKPKSSPSFFEQLFCFGGERQPVDS